MRACHAHPTHCARAQPLRWSVQARACRPAAPPCRARGAWRRGLRPRPAPCKAGRVERGGRGGAEGRSPPPPPPPPSLLLLVYAEGSFPSVARCLSPGGPPRNPKHQRRLEECPHCRRRRACRPRRPHKPWRLVPSGPRHKRWFCAMCSKARHCRPRRPHKPRRLRGRLQQGWDAITHPSILQHCCWVPTPPAAPTIQLRSIASGQRPGPKGPGGWRLLQPRVGQRHMPGAVRRRRLHQKGRRGTKGERAGRGRRAPAGMGRRAHGGRAPRVRAGGGALRAAAGCCQRWRTNTFPRRREA